MSDSYSRNYTHTWSNISRKKRVLHAGRAAYVNRWNGCESGRAFNTLFDEKHASYGYAAAAVRWYLYGLLDGHGSSLGRTDDADDATHLRRSGHRVGRSRSAAPTPHPRASNNDFHNVLPSTSESLSDISTRNIQIHQKYKE